MLAGLTGQAQAADWYVAPGGANASAGSEGSPFETVAHAVSQAQTGDNILLQSDGVYGVQELRVAGLNIAAYGTGEDPILTASREVALPDSWGTDANVRIGNVPERVIAVYVNGRFVRLARYPNTGFLTVDNANAPDSIVDAELSQRPGVAAGRWTGAQVRWRRWSWWWETRPITDHGSNNTLQLGPDGRFQDPFSEVGSGYFIDNDLDELDAPGEWFWGDGQLYLYPPAWADPQTMRVQVVTTEVPGVIASDASLSHIQFQRFAGTALQLDGPTTVEDCTFSEIEVDAIQYTWNAQPFIVRSSVFRDVRNTAIQGWADANAPSGTLIERNLFHRIGWERGYGGSGSWHATAVILGQASSAIFRLNRVVETGYAGILLGSDGQTVQQNIFVRTMGTLNDGAAIYTNCNQSFIRENIILDTMGDLETSHEWWPLGHGIWPEFLSNFRDTEITDNTIFGSNGFGIYLPNNFTCTVSGNTSVANRRAGFALSGNAGDNQQHSIVGNILAAVSPDPRIQKPENLSMWWLPPYPEPLPVALEYDPALNYGAMSQTTLVAAVNNAAVVRAGETELDTLAAWTGAAGWADGNGSKVERANSYLLFNDTETAQTMTVPTGQWRTTDASAVGASITVAPFRSVLLLTDGPVPTNPPYQAASGVDWRAAEPTGSVLGEVETPGDGGVPGPTPDGGVPGPTPDGGTTSDGSVPTGGDAGVDAPPGGGNTPVVGGCTCSESPRPLAWGSLMSLIGVFAFAARRRK